MRPIPDFCIVGAPKCGTTSLFEALRRHPDVFMASQKEPNFFATDLPSISMIRDAASYRRLYDRMDDGQISGEGSVWYLFSSAAPMNIRSANPNARIIILLRNPVHAFVSLHNHYILSLQENLFDPEEAWNAQAQRRLGEALPFYCPEPSLLQYRDVYRYAGQVERYLDCFGPDRVKVVIFEELVADPAAGLDEILAFLGAATDVGVNLQRDNSARQFIDPRLARLLTAPPPPVGALMLATKRTLNRVGVRPIHLLHRLTRPKSEDARLRGNFRRELMDVFDPNVRALEDLLGISLAGHWWPPRRERDRVKDLVSGRKVS